MGGSSQPSGNTTTVQTSQPPAYLAPHLQHLAQVSSDWFGDRYGRYENQPMSREDWQTSQLGPLGEGSWSGVRRAAEGQDYDNYITQFDRGEWIPGSAEYNPDFPTVAGFTPWQIEGQQSAANYAGGGGQNLAGAAQQAALSGLDPNSNPYVQGMAGNLPAQQNYLQSIWNQPSFSGGAPQIGFDPQRINVDQQSSVDPSAAINQMMSGTPDMSIYSPLYEQIGQQSKQLWEETINPAIRSEAIGAGAYGTPKYRQAMGQEAERLQNSMNQSMERLTADAANRALQQRAQGVGYGLGATGQDLSRAISQAGFDAGVQNLGADLAARQAGLDFSGMQLGEQARAARAGEGLSAAGIYGNQFGNMYGNALDTMGRSLALAPSTYGLGTAPGETMMNLGAQQQAQQQAEMGDQYQRWQNDQLGPYGDLGRYMGLLTGQAAGYGTQTASQPYFSPSPIQNALTGGMLGYGLGGMIPGLNPWLGAGMGALGLGLFG